MTRVAITGVGCVSPLGLSAAATLHALQAGASGIRAMPTALSRHAPTLGPVPLDATTTHPPATPAHTHTGTRQSRPRYCHLAVLAAQEAWIHAQLHLPHFQGSHSVGVNIGCSVGGLGDIEAASVLLHQQKYTKISPYFIPNVLCNMAAAHVAMALDVQVGSRTVCVCVCLCVYVCTYE